jgi:hypothetical protein
MSILDIFTEHCGDLKIDKDFVKSVIAMERRFVNKNHDHVEFFGGALTGVQTVRFLPEDYSVLYDDVLHIDADLVQEQIYALPDINKDFAISSDVFGIASVWVMHAILTSRYLSAELKYEGMLRMAMYQNCRYLTSILYNFFKFPANPATAQATYAAMSYRFGLKEAGSWGKFLQKRSNDVIDKESIHHHTITKCGPDYDIVTMLNDVQGRIKSVMINIYSLFIDIHNRGVRIGSSSDLIEIDGEVILKDRIDALASYTRYIKDIVTDKHSFIKQDLFDIVIDVMPTASPHQFTEFLQWFSTNYMHYKTGALAKVLDDVMTHAFDYLSENRGLLRNHDDITGMLVKMRGTYTSSRQSSPRLMDIKRDVESLISYATKVKNESALASLRTAFCLYVLLRALTKRYYSQ